MQNRSEFLQGFEAFFLYKTVGMKLTLQKNLEKTTSEKEKLAAANDRMEEDTVFSLVTQIEAICIQFFLILICAKGNQ